MTQVQDLRESLEIFSAQYLPTIQSIASQTRETAELCYTFASVSRPDELIITAGKLLTAIKLLTSSFESATDACTARSQLYYEVNLTYWNLKLHSFCRQYAAEADYKTHVALHLAKVSEYVVHTLELALTRPRTADELNVWRNNAVDLGKAADAAQAMLDDHSDRMNREAQLLESLNN